MNEEKKMIEKKSAEMKINWFSIFCVRWWKRDMNEEKKIIEEKSVEKVYEN